MIDVDEVLGDLSDEDRGKMIRSLFANELQKLAIETDKERIEELEDGIATLSAMMYRRSMAAFLGKSFGGDRDTFEALGYPKELRPEHYAAKYERNEIAGRIVDLPPNASWKQPPTIKDDSVGDKKLSPFLEGLGWLVKHKMIWAVLNAFDRKLGIGEFGVLLIGVKGTGKLETPLSKGNRTHKAISYLRPYSHDNISNIEYDEDEESDRFGLPKFYTLDFGSIGGKGLGQRRIHYTRVIHAAENAPSGEVFGRSRLKRPYNRLEDMERMIGATSESAWRLAIKGMVIQNADGYGSFDPIKDKLKEKVEAFIHNLDRTMILDGGKVQEFGGEMVDPTGLFGALAKLLATGADIPVRILFGEEGYLAGSQDQEHWAATITTRQNNFVSPFVLRPFIDWCIKYGLLKEPKGEYTIEWVSNFEKPESEAAQTSKSWAEALAMAITAKQNGAAITDEEIRAFGGLPDTPESTAVIGNIKKLVDMAEINGRLSASNQQLTALVSGLLRDKGAAAFLPISANSDELPTIEQIEEAMRRWDRDFPQYAGLLDTVAGSG